MKIKNRILSFLILSILILIIQGCGVKKEAKSKKRIIIIGFDGMDYELTKEMLKNNELKNLKSLSRSGSFKKLYSSVVAQSPVAWSNFITGSTAYEHKIFDFIHRDPKTLLPYLSMAKKPEEDKFFTLGKYKIPYKTYPIQLLRKRESFWKILEGYNIKSTIYKIPSNFPPEETEQRTISGMGTPDLFGGYGTYQIFTDKIIKDTSTYTAGIIHNVKIKNNSFTSYIYGGYNPLLKNSQYLKEKIEVHIDNKLKSVLIRVNNKEIILREKEFSDFVKLEFNVIPYIYSIKGIVRFYLNEISPDFKLYVSPVNIDLIDQVMPLTTGKGFKEELYNHLGYFYTQGMAEMPKALTEGALTEEEWIRHSDLIEKNRVKAFKYLINNFRDNILFFYFSTTDLNGHMFFGYDNNKRMKEIYKRMDQVVGYAMRKMKKDDLLIIMSDHGFKPFKRKVHINTFLKENGYLSVIDENDTTSEYLQNIDWENTKAYAIGLNALYINLAGRERYGIVLESEKKKLMHEIAKKLESIVDKKTGEKVISKVYITSEFFNAKGEDDVMPDMLIGYNPGYRSSWETALGAVPDKIIEDNTEHWRADHCMDFRKVPGILFTNKKLKKNEVYLYDLGVSILNYFGVKKLDYMKGKNIFSRGD